MATVVTQWNEEILQAIRTTHPGPPIVARMLAVAHTCMYDAWAAYDDVAEGTRLGGLLRRPVDEHSRPHRHEAVSYAAYRAAVDLFPTEKAHFDQRLTQLGYDPTNASTDPTTPAGIGNLAAKAVLEFRHGDGSNQLGTLTPSGDKYADWTHYASVNTPSSINDSGRWQPLSVDDGHGGTADQHFIAPHWGLVEPFALRIPIDDVPGSPQPPGSEGYRIQCKDVLRYSAELTDRHKVIAEYWADGPKSELPPGHWCLFAKDVSDRDNHNIGQDVRMFFALTNAVFAASILCWGLKRRFDYVRPVTAIHHLFAGKQVKAWGGKGLGTKMIDGANWKPYQAPTVVTPPFPEYYSGHSVFSAAAAESSAASRAATPSASPRRSKPASPMSNPAWFRPTTSPLSGTPSLRPRTKPDSHDATAASTLKTATAAPGH